MVSAALALRYPRASYWKPIQTGTSVDDDTRTVVALTGLDSSRILDQGVRLPDPLSPHLAAQRQGVRLALEPLVALAASQAPERPWIVEGAGGVLVPIHDSALMIDLVKQLGLPALIVSRTTLGTINHTLLTLEALRTRGVPIAGVVMNGVANAENRWSIEAYGCVSVIGEMPSVHPLDAAALEREARAVDPEGRLASVLQ